MSLVKEKYLKTFLIVISYILNFVCVVAKIFSHCFEIKLYPKFV